MILLIILNRICFYPVGIIGSSMPTSMKSVPKTLDSLKMMLIFSRYLTQSAFAENTIHGKFIPLPFRIRRH